LAREARIAGSTPETKVAKRVMASTKSRIGPSMRMSIQNGGRVLAMAPLKSFTPIAASPTPSTAPMPARASGSVRNWRMIRPRVAPTAVRMPTSFARMAACESSRLATLAQAMSSTRNTANSMVISSWRGSLPMMESVYGSTYAVMSLLVSGFCWATRRATPATSTPAASRVTPGLRRPKTSHPSSSARRAGIARRRGTQICSATGNAKRFGMMPITSAGSALTRMLRPMMERSPP